MQWWEVNRFMLGLQRRQRNQWETTRHLEWLLTNMFGDHKKGVIPRTPTDFFKFPWEEELQNGGPQISEEEAKEMQDMLKEINQEGFSWNG